MSIRLIEKGARDVDIDYVTTCDSCKSKLVYNESDVKEDWWDYDFRVFIRCPICNGYAHIPLFKIFWKKYKEPIDKQIKKELSSSIKDFLGK